MKRLLFLPLVLALLNNLSAQETDSITDIRNGKVYKIVKIGSDYWLAENLNAGTMIDSLQDPTDNGIIEKYCYSNSDSLCDTYGGLYTWDEMMDYQPSDIEFVGTTQGICPVGWHLPTDEEWNVLVEWNGGAEEAGGRLKDTGTVHWLSPNTDATNATGFTALPGGGIGIENSFDKIGKVAVFWSATEFNGLDSWRQKLTCISGEILRETREKDRGHSVRCLIDSVHLKYLNVLDNNLTTLSDMDFTNEETIDTIVISNSGATGTINISSIHTNQSFFTPNKSSANLLPGDSIHLTISFNPPGKDIYRDTLFIESDDTKDPIIGIPLFATYPMEISFTDSSNISCGGLADGMAKVKPALGTPPYQIQWNDSQNSTTPRITGLDANVFYTAVVSDSKGEILKDSIMLTEPDPVQITFDYSEVVCLGIANGYITCEVEGGTPPFEYSWTHGPETLSLTGMEAGIYTLEVTDSLDCERSAEFTIQSVEPFADEKICLVTIDLATGKNLIVWEKTSDEGIVAYNIHREATIGEYNVIGTKSVDEMSVLLDETGEPESQTYLYKITVTDTCGNESLLAGSQYHKPSFLQYVSAEGGINLVWTDYIIQGTPDIGEYLSSYIIYRGTAEDGLTEYKTVGSINNFTDTDPNALKYRYYYRVAAVLNDPCIPNAAKKSASETFTHALSNIEDNRLTDTATAISNSAILPITIYPNPFNQTTTIKFSNPDGYEYILYITDISGKTCRIIEHIADSEVTLEKGDLKEGIYFVELKGPEVFRGKLIIK